MKWIFVHGDYGMAQLQQNNEIWNYVQKNYEIAQIGLFKTNDGYSPVYFVLKKGGQFNITEMQTKQVVLEKTYSTKGGSVNLYTIQR
jgi:hypothetical protein